MARIRTIKPELPASETLGSVSREARLCFILLLTVADDEGRLAANHRVLAGVLYPFDDDARQLIPAWLSELERVGCIQTYVADGKNYAHITGWSKHQRIDRPSKSRLPDPPTPGAFIINEASAIDCEESANTREDSSRAREPSQSDPRSLDAGPRTMDHGPASVPGGTEGAQRKPAAIGEAFLVAQGVPPQAAKDWLKVRKSHRAPLTESAWNGLVEEAAKAGITPAQAVEVCARKSWRGFSHTWDWQSAGVVSGVAVPLKPRTRQEERRNTMAALGGEFVTGEGHGSGNYIDV